MRVRCPSCGISHTIEDEASKPGTFASSYRRPYRNDAATVAFSQPQASREAPTGFPSMDTHVRIPLRQAMISGLFDAPVGAVIGLGAGLSIALMTDAASLDSFTLSAYILIAGTGGLIGGMVSFCKRAKVEWPKRLNAYDALLWIEEITDLDLNGDGEIGEPDEPATLRIELRDKAGIPRLIAEFDTDPERFGELARLILVLDEGFSEATASKAGYSRKEWERIRDKFFSLQAAAWKNRNHTKQGIDLGSRGYDILKAALDFSSPPVLLAGDAPKIASGTNVKTRTNDLSSRFEHIER